MVFGVDSPSNVKVIASSATPDVFAQTMKKSYGSGIIPSYSIMYLYLVLPSICVGGCDIIVYFGILLFRLSLLILSIFTVYVSEKVLLVPSYILYANESCIIGSDDSEIIS